MQMNIKIFLIQILLKKRIIGRKEREESDRNCPNENEVSSAALLLCDSEEYDEKKRN